ncbi:MAG TPA: hypothetical protein ENJ28_08480 [Gammaproteobacteria bacterium]|nr:hypothetical protein [Gammaproteobacteria bacterium]
MQILNTIKILSSSNATIIFVQNPSLLLSAIVVLYGKFLHKTTIIDAHNAGIFPIEGKSIILNKTAQLINSLSTNVIISNPALKPFINKKEDKIFAIPDPIPEISRHNDYPLKHDKINLVFICSWALDEPFGAVFKMAENIANTTHIYITGNSKGKEKTIINKLPTNVTLTGFLPNDKYNDLIHGCDAIMVLTNRDNCLVCGAYEGVAVEKPMVLSKKKALVHHFNKGSVYTDNTSSNIEKSIKQLINNYDKLSCEIKTLKKELKSNMESTLFKFSKMIDNYST